ncbi:hypothetical protein KVV02_006986, partial [Mortierella alpina]
MHQPCSQKAGYAYLNSSTTTIMNHLRKAHNIGENSPMNRSRLSGPIDSAFENSRKRSAEQFTSQALDRQFCKVLIRNQMPYNTVECPEMLKLLKVAQSAPSQDAIKLPSNDTIARRVSNWYKESERLIVEDFANVPMVAFTLDGWTSPFQMSFLAITAHWINDEWEQEDI